MYGPSQFPDSILSRKQYFLESHNIGEIHTNFVLANAC